MARLQQTQRKRVGSVPRLPDDVVAAIAAEERSSLARAEAERNGRNEGDDIEYSCCSYYTLGRLTEKSDVFSFGVVLLEMITRVYNLKKQLIEFIVERKWGKELIYLRGLPSKQWEIREFQGGKDPKSRVSGEALKLSFVINVSRKLMEKDEWLSFVAEAVEEVKAQREIPEIKPGYIIQLKVETLENNTTIRLRRLITGIGVKSLFPFVYAFQGISCISEEESSRISLGMCSPLREEKNGQITAKKRSKPGFFPVGSCAPAQQC
ncbi:hypothetical protein AgCh_028736 [Apium graveolens]